MFQQRLVRGLRHRMLVRDSSGYTFVEILIVASLIMILASAVQPLAKVAIQRQREVELRRALRELRTAIDDFQQAAVGGGTGGGQIPTTALKPDSEGYPPSLEILVEGVTPANDASGRKLRFLRRVPMDPITRSTEWGMRSYQDKPESTSWGGQNVFDVYSKSEGRALDGSKYRDW